MEMLTTMMTQPQDMTALVPGMAAASNTPAGMPRLSATPLLFASLLQEILPAAQPGEEPAEMALKLTPTGKGTIPGKGNSGANLAPETADDQGAVGEQSPGQTGSQLAQLLAMTGQFLAGQSIPQPAPVVSKATGSEGKGQTGSPGTEGEESDAPDFRTSNPVCGSVQCPVVEGVVSPSAVKAAIPGKMAAPGQTPVQQSVWASAIAQGQVGKPGQPIAAAVSAERKPAQIKNAQADIAGVSVQTTEAITLPNTKKAGTDQSAQWQTGKPAQQVTEGTILPNTKKTGTDAAPQGKGRAALSAQWQTGKPAQPIAAASPERDGAQIQNAQSPLGGVPVQITEATTTPNSKKAGTDAASQGKTTTEQSAQGQTGKLSQPTAVVSSERDSGQIQNAQSPLGGVPVQITEATTLPNSKIAGADTSQQVKTTDEPMAKVQARQAQANIDYASLFGRGHAVQAGLEVLPPAVAGNVAGSPANLPVEVVFTDPSANGKSSGEKESRKSGSKAKENESTQGLAINAERTFDMPGASRFSLQPKVEEPKNILHESIMDQVKASVVSHDSKGNGTITVRLHPEELGDLQVNVRIENQRVKVEIITDNRTVRDALMGNLDNLKETFQKQNLSMERFDVSTGGGNGFNQGFKGEKGDQRHNSPLPFRNEAVPFEVGRENGEDDWGVTDNSLVNLRL